MEDKYVTYYRVFFYEDGPRKGICERELYRINGKSGHREKLLAKAKQSALFRGGWVPDLGAAEDVTTEIQKGVKARRNKWKTNRFMST